MNNNQRKTKYQEKYQREFPYKWFQYCKDQLEEIEGWDKMLNDTSGQRWHLHHRAEISEDGEVVSRDELIRRGEYYGLTASKLLFLTKPAHTSLHNRDGRAPWSGKHLSAETKKKVSENNWMRGRTGGLSPVSKPIEIDGVPYVSRRAAAKALGKCRKTIWRWLQEGKAKYL